MSQNVDENEEYELNNTPKKQSIIKSSLANRDQKQQQRRFITRNSNSNDPESRNLLKSKVDSENTDIGLLLFFLLNLYCVNISKKNKI
jgi:hypothetical protein